MLQDVDIYVDEPAVYAPRGDHIEAMWKGRRFVIPICVGHEIARRLDRALAEWREQHSGSVAQLHGVDHAASS